jgi:hypothetical protein
MGIEVLTNDSGAEVKKLPLPEPGWALELLALAIFIAAPILTWLL